MRNEREALMEIIMSSGIYKLVFLFVIFIGCTTSNIRHLCSTYKEKE